MTNTIYIHQPEKAFSFTRLPNFLFEAPTFRPLSNEAGWDNARRSFTCWLVAVAAPDGNLYVGTWENGLYKLNADGSADQVL